MIGINYLLMCFLYFVCIGLDVVMFFLQIRLVVMWKKINWLVPFDDSGKSLVNMVMHKVSLLLIKKQLHLSERGKLLVALVILAIIRIILGAMLKQV